MRLQEAMNLRDEQIDEITMFNSVHYEVLKELNTYAHHCSSK